MDTCARRPGLWHQICVSHIMLVLEERNLHLNLASCVIFSLFLLQACLVTVKLNSFPKIFHKTSELFELCLVILGITSEPIFWVMLNVVRSL